MVTEVKSDEINAASGASSAVVVDLGLAIGEAAKIVGVALTVYGSTIPTAPLFGLIEGGYSFDPEDEVVNRTDDEQFAYVAAAFGLLAASTGVADFKEEGFFDFTNMGLITTRNVALVMTAAGLNGIVVGKVYYERYKPTVNDLNMLIAKRR